MDIRDILFPKRCVGCGRIGWYVCASCASDIIQVSENEKICPMCGRTALDGATHPGCRRRYGLDGLTSFFRYRGIVRKAIKSLKYRLVSDLASEFSALMPDSVMRDISKHAYNAVLLPMPLHPSRQKMRGFNQAEALGVHIATRLQIPVSPDILYRTRNTVAQADIKKREDRLKNMQEVFACKQKVFPRNIVLFDDVFTTGATMRSAATALKHAGAKRVWAVTVAR